MLPSYLSIGLNAVLLILSLSYSLLISHQNNENKQGNSEEYRKLKYLIFILFLICLIAEIQVIIDFNSQDINIENL